MMGESGMGEAKRGKGLQIAIIGAGLGGLSLARMLRVKGLRATIFDKDRDADERSVGGSLDMHEESGLYAIQQAGLFEQFQELARYEDQGMRLFNREGERVFEANDGNRPEIDRGQLRKMLLDSIPGEWLRWGHELESVGEATDGGFELAFRGGAKERADFVVGADGVWSRVRAAVTEARPRYSGLTFFELEIRDVDGEHPEVGEFIRKGLMMAMAEQKLISAQRNAAGNVRVYAALFVPEDGETKNGYATVKAKDRGEILQSYAGWAKKLVHLFEVAGEAVRPWPIYVLPVGLRWSNKPGVTLIGDAAHVMPPAGDGANLAMRDGVDLACALADTGDVEGAVAEFETAMFERAKDAAAMASAALLEGTSEERLALIKQAMSGEQ
jgi:2-polyprenyl-6-methoxyphenol hydroxylase-like FAD-dependent oxidoreductase